MHRIDTDTATVEGLFTEGDPGAGTPPTIMSDDWANAIQEELCHVIEGVGGVLDKANNYQLFHAIVDFHLPIGTIQFLSHYVAPSAANPRFCLAAPNAVLDAANWPDLVPYLRARKLYYNIGFAGEKSAFDIASWARTSNVVTLTFANTDGENAALAALLANEVIHGSYTAWRTVTVPALGAGAAGEYAITNINTGARTLTFAQTAADATGTTSTAIFYNHRLATADDATGVKARHFVAVGRAAVAVDDVAGALPYIWGKSYVA